MSYDANGANYCLSENETRMHGKIIAQTIFLGASVMDYNCNLGWGTQPSTLTVNLVNDNAAPLIDTSPGDTAVGCGDDQHGAATDFANNQNDYYQFGGKPGNPIYVNKNNVSCSVHDPTARVKAKVYYQTDFPAATSGKDAGGKEFSRPYNSGTLQVDQYWWASKDPGFLGDANNILSDGSVKPTATNRLYSVEGADGPEGPTDFLDLYANRGYNITNCPVFFKMGDFSFGGFVQSWKKNKSNSGDVYSVVVNSPQSILNTCTVILDKYGGSIAGSLSNFEWSAPTNYVGNQLDYNTTNNSYGNLPNIFNVYGFLESFGSDYFGGSSYKLDEGFLVTEIITGLRILAGADDLTLRASTTSDDFASKNAFSPYGRILAPAASDPITGKYFTSSKWGLIAPTPGHWTGNNRCQFRLDLSDLHYAIAGSDKRIKSDSMSISELIDQICEDHGLDWTTSMINTNNGWVIKIIAVSRRFAPLVNGIQSTVSKLVCNNLPVGNFSYGKEKNDAASRSLVIGPNQQRLYQAKSTRLAYTQSNYIFNPGSSNIDDQGFVDYYTLGKITIPDLGEVNCTTNTGARVSVDSSKTFGYGKIRFPAFFSTRNPALDNRATSLKNDEEVKSQLGLAFNDRDSVFEDNEVSPDTTQIRSGNYAGSQFISHGVDARYALDPCSGTDIETLGISDVSNITEQSNITARRFFPLYRDTICPFFGYLLENRYSIEASNKNTDFRRIRPVWYDFWTGQICVLFHKAELPKTRIDLKGRYTNYKLNRASSTNLIIPSVAFHTEGYDPEATPGPTSEESPQEAPTPNYTAEWFMVTESEIRSAMTGPDSYASYSLGKIYKTDIYIMLHNAYIARDKQKYINEGYSEQVATQKALKNNDWKWSFINENLCGAEGNAEASKNAGSTSLYTLPGEARKDLDLVANFIKSVGQEYYGKKYMVMAPYLQSRTETTPYSFSLQNDLGTINVFKGGGEIRHSYEPCGNEDGAWEEYGNQIDDNIVCGDENWSILSNDKGLINPILGYNATEAFDYQRYALALSSVANADGALNPGGGLSGLNPYFSYSAWDDAQEYRGNPAPSKFYFENLLLSDLASNAGSFVIVDCMANSSLKNTVDAANPFTPLPKITGPDAFGKSHGSIKRKLYINCSVENKFSFLDPEKMLDAKMIVETNPLRLNNSSEQYQTDPSNTVSATVGMEDLAIYTRAGGRRKDRIEMFVRFMSPYVSKFGTVQKDINQDDANARNVKISPKCAHPLFVGIPIKSNIYSYGPWTNYPALSPTSEIFATGVETYISNSNVNYSQCVDLTLDLPTDGIKHQLIDNWIGDTKFEIVPDFAPWNFGGMRGLDDIVTKYVSGNANYQTNIEAGGVDIAGSPIFNLGGSFDANARNGYIQTKEQKETYVFTEVKIGGVEFGPPILTKIQDYMEMESVNYLQGTINYLVPDVAIINADGNRIRHDSYTQAPILTNIMTTMGQNGISTKYSFRTYTRKLSLFDRQDVERFKKMTQQNMLRKKEISNLKRSITNSIFSEKRSIKKEANTAAAGTQQPASMMLGTSPVTTIVCTANKFLPKFSGLNENGFNSSFSAPELLFGNQQESEKVKYQNSDDPGGNGHLDGGFSNQTDDSQLPYLYLEHRVNTDTKIYTDSEMGDSLRDNWSNSSVMSLDGIFSPISFYPTLTKSTFSISKYDTKTCPICRDTKKVKRSFKRYPSDKASLEEGTEDYYCDSCVKPYEKLHGSSYVSTTTTTPQGQLYPPFITTTGNSTSELKAYSALTHQSRMKDKTARLGVSLNIPINITTLQPIVMPQHEFRNANAQSYEGSHPDGVHPQLYIDEINRTFVDKGRNSISVIGKGSIYKEIVGAGFKSSTQLLQPGSVSKDNVKNYDYDYLDSRFIDRFSGTNYENIKYEPEHNMRFVGLRGPLMIHGWGYDTEGYPVPNACDEPYHIDPFGRPMRFKRTRELGPAVTYSSLAVGSAFLAESKKDESETVKLANLTLQNDTDRSRGGSTNIELDTEVYEVIYADDMNSDGGYLPDEFQGSIISKTQSKGDNGWTKKVRLKQFYLNWAERPDIWPVGPVDLRWDENRKVWGMNTPKTYKDVYITLEEDMIKDPDLDDTFPARGFFDDISYSTQVLGDNERKLVYVRDRSGYTAPRGARLYCRYDVDTGYYEPISKQQFIVYGTIAPGSNTATITMSYVQGKRKGDGAPYMAVIFQNPLDLSTIQGVGMFTYTGGSWTLISTKD